MYPPYKEGDDVTSLINGVKEGDDVTNLINGSTVKKPEPSLKSKLLKGSLWDPEDTRPITSKLKDVGTRFLSGQTEEDKKNSKFKLVGPLTEDSLLPTNITGKKEPESYWGGFSNSLYKDFVRPFASDSAALAMISPGKISPTASHAAELVAADKGLPINPKAVPMPENYGRPQGAANAKLGLPPAPSDITGVPTAEIKNPNVRFINGPAGTAEAAKTYPMDIAPQNPKLGQTDAGTILPRETEGITQLPGAEAARLGTRLGDISKIETSSPKANLVSLDKVRQGSPVQLPTKEGLSTGGINLPEVESPYQSASAPKQPKIKPQALGATAGETGNTIPQGEPKSFEVAKSNSNAKPSSGVPSPGGAVAEAPTVLSHSNSKDISSIRAEFGSVDRTLGSRPETAPIAQALTTAQDTKTKWIAETERTLADLTKGLDKSGRIELGEILDRGVSPQDHPELAARATQIRTIMDDIWKQIPGAKTDLSVGFIENYLTHIKNSPSDLSDGMKQIWEYHFKQPFQKMFGGAELAGKGESLGDMYEKGLGNPNSPFVRTRTGALKDIELDVNKVLPAYVESIAKLIHDRPAVDAVKKIIATLPDTDIYGEPSKLKELSQWYVKNYTRYDSMPGLSQAWNDWTSRLMRTTARSMLGFSTGLQTLHLARIPTNLYPELGEKYLAHGAAQVMKNPKAAFAEAASLGLLQNEVRPFSFRRPMEKADSILSFFSAADFLDKSIGYHGFKQKFLDQGMDAASAQMQAIAASKKASLTVDSSRVIKGATNDAKVFGGMAGRLSTQFKQVPVKIIEQYVALAAEARKNPANVPRMIAGMGIAVAAADAGLHTFHLSPGQFAIDMGGATFSVFTDIYRNVMKGNVVKALEDTALWLTPGGRSVTRQMKQGLSMFEHENKDIPMPR